MKLAIISDIHANLQALEAVWDDIQTLEPDEIYCLGDLVGYGANPNEVINFIRDHAVPTIIGNYDEGVGLERDSCGCVYNDPRLDRLGERSIWWSRGHSTEDNKAFLLSLPTELRPHPGLLLVHGSPRRINEYLPEDRPDVTFERIAKVAEAEMLLFGHTHIPYEKHLAGTHFVNTGSVGRPKDGDPRAGYVILRGNEVEFRRVDYDIRSAATAIRESDLPDYYADELETGGRTEPVEIAGMS